ncbi:MAG: PEP-utilizing enzyme [Candidatus Jordarchaeum sp.]|uniref:PEP-utilizing enzyme n=1 Tax=Candidatus Jordarchaeum sp. TaxID=2823881 RepID=UPI00404B2DF4
MSYKKIAEGMISCEKKAEGELVVIKTVQDVVSLLKSGAEGKIPIVQDAGTTTLAPVLSRICGVVCLSGGLGAHLAIVTREFGIPGLMGAEIKYDGELNGKKAKIVACGESKGELHILED